MKRILILAAVFLFLASSVLAADLTLSWDPVVNAKGYRIYKSLDVGTTWSMYRDVLLVVPYKLTTQEETGLILYRVSAYFNDGSELICYDSGAFFNFKWDQHSPGGSGIK